MYETTNKIKENKYKTDVLNCPDVEMKLTQNSFTTVWSCFVVSVSF